MKSEARNTKSERSTKFKIQMFKTKFQSVLNLGFGALNLFRISFFACLRRQGFRASARQRGTTLIDAIVGSALMVVVFVGLFGIIRLAVMSVGLGKAKTGAVALANEQIEYIRSLPYNSVAVAGGIPAGSIPATQTITLNNIPYTRRTFVQYIDSSVDGVGQLDTNGIQADYKVAKVTVSWPFRGGDREVTLITNVVPRGIETLDGGGTLVVNVVNASGVVVPDASVTIRNTSVSPNINISTYSNSTGAANFPGAPVSSAYQVTATKAGYSTDQTYLVTATNTNPTPGTLTVISDRTTSSTFRIDLLADLAVRSFTEVRAATWTDSFVDMSQIDEDKSSNITVSGGNAGLISNAGIYASSGLLMSTSVAPTYLYGWKAAQFEKATPAGTAIRVRVYHDTATTTELVPDAVLAGNAAGFTLSPISLTTLSTTTYPSLRLAADLSTSGTSTTPALYEWRITYDEGPIPRPNSAFTIRGTKTIGTLSGNPVYKYQSSFNTGSSASSTLENIEWDSYLIAKASSETTVSVAESCPFQPVGVNPGTAQSVNIIFAPASTNSLLVYVTSASGTPIKNASVRLSRSGYDTTVLSSSCGQSFFRSLSSANYTLRVSATGYVSQTINNVSVSGAATRTVLLNPS